MKKKVLIFCQDGVGGAERMTAMIGRNLDRERFDILFCLVKREVKSSIVDFIPKEVKRIWVTNNGVASLMLNMAKTLIKEKPDIVFSSVFNLSNKLLLLRCLFPKAKFVIRCDNYLYTYNEKQKKLLKKTYPKADMIIAQTEEMGQELIVQVNIPDAKVKVLHNPIDKELIDKKINRAENPYPKNGRKHYVAVGRFDPQKGFDLLMDAFVIAHEKDENIDLYIIGDTSMNGGRVAENVKQKAEKAGVGELLHFCGYKDNPYPYIKYANCFVLSSRWEGLPNVLIESLYLGTPVTAFKCIPIVERIVDDSVDGFLAEKEDVKGLSSSMLKAAELGRVSSSYKSSSISDFTQLFYI